MVKFPTFKVGVHMVLGTLIQGTLVGYSEKTSQYRFYWENTTDMFMYA